MQTACECFQEIGETTKKETIPKRRTMVSSKRCAAIRYAATDSFLTPAMPAIRTTQHSTGFIRASALLPRDAPPGRALPEKTANTDTEVAPSSQGSMDEGETARAAANARVCAAREEYRAYARFWAFFF